MRQHRTRVWAMDLVSAEKTVASWKAGGARSPAAAHTRTRRHDLRRDGRGQASPTSNAIVALEPKTLKQKAQAVIPDANVERIADCVLAQG